MDQETADRTLRKLRALNPKRQRVALIALVAMMLMFFILVIWDVMSKVAEKSHASWSRVNQAMDRGNLSDALKMAQELTQKTPKYPGAYGALGSVCFQMGDFAAAEEHYVRACEMLPSETYRDYLRSVRLARAASTNAATTAETDERYTIETHATPVTHLSGQDQKGVTENGLFKLDSYAGSVWRLDTNGFRRIAVRDLVSQKSDTEWQERQVFKRLDAIKIPEINFRQESLSNVVAFLQNQIKQLDATIAAGSQEFIRLRYIDFPFLTPPITFIAREVSALEALKTITDIAALEYRLEVDHILITSPPSRDGEVVSRIYEVSPVLRDRLRGTTINNVLSELGFDLEPWTELKYSPELDIIIAGTSDWEHLRLQELLVLTDLARQWPGRFRLVSRVYNENPVLLLLDGKTGQTWFYQAVVMKDGSRQESFDLVQSNWYQEKE